MEQLKNYFKDKAVWKVLDVGTGPGHFIKVLNNVFPKALITGVDPDETSLEKAALEYPGVIFQNMSGEKLDFNDNSFDVAGISMALHHLSDIQSTLHEMKRVVRPGGWIVIVELFRDGQNPAQEVHKRMHHFGSRIDRMTGITHNEAFTRKEIVAQIEKSGLQIELKFEFKNSGRVPLKKEIEGRKAKLWEAVKRIENRAEYDEMVSEIPAIETALEKYGFEMATRLVCVASVSK